MGEAFLFRIRHQEYAKPIIAALEIIANPKNHPLLFHCGAGKNRSGLLAAFVVSILGVSDDDIIADYTLWHLTCRTWPSFFKDNRKRRMM